MNKRSTKFFLPTLFCISFCSLNYALTTETITVLAPKEAKESNLPKKDSPYKRVPAPLQATTGQKIWFKFKDEPLIDVVNYIASAKNINVVLPQGQDALTTKITYQFPDKISVEQAHEKLLSILKLAGYLFIPQGDFYYIVKTDKDLNKQTFPLYINTPPSDLPDVDQMIRYVYYFANIQVPPAASSGGGGFGGGASGNALQTLLTDTLGTSSTFTYMVDPSTNGIIITGYARNIRSIMEIVTEIDSHGFTDSIEIMPLTHTDATTITSLLMTQLITSAASGSSTQGGFGGGGFGQPVAAQATPSASSYFTPTTKVVAETRSNSLIIMGKKDAITRIKDFVRKYIDVPLDSGDSILHIYPLQYLNAQTFAPILTQIVNSQSGGSSIGSGFGGSTGQSSGTANPSAGKQYFKGVIIQAEIVAPVAAAAPTSTSSSTSSSGTAPQAAQQGGNRLIIAALREDWARLKKLISDLDRPQPQVAIEMLIVDFTLTGAQALGSQVRNKQGMLPRGVNAQNSILGPLQFDNPTNPAWNGLMANLLQIPDANGNNLVGGSAPQGTFVLSLQDNVNTGIAWVMEALLSYTNVTILSHPFTVTLNNQPTSFTDNQTLLLPGSATVKKGATYVPIAPVTAALQLNITPMINGENYINLGLNVQISEFSTGNSQICRNIQTNANVKDGQVLILGGLTKTTTATSNLATPGLENIPIIGWLFKKKSKGVIKSNLAVFICPRILQSTNGYCDPFTAEKFSVATDAVNLDKNFTALRDPITRWFFGSAHEITNEQKVSDYLNRKQFITEQNYKKTKVLAQAAGETKQPLPTPPLPIKKELPSKTVPSLKIAQASSKKDKETIILTTKNNTEQAELKRLFSTFSQSNSMHDLATQTKANLL